MALFSRQEKKDPDVFVMGEREFRLNCSIEEDGIFTSVVNNQLLSLLKTNIGLRLVEDGEHYVTVSSSTVGKTFSRTFFYNFVGNDLHYLFTKPLKEKFRSLVKPEVNTHELVRCREIFATLGTTVPSRALEARLGRFYKTVHETYGASEESIENTVDEYPNWFWYHQYNVVCKGFFYSMLPTFREQVNVFNTNHVGSTM